MKRSSLIATAIGLSIPLGLSLPNALATDYTFNTAGNFLTATNWNPNPTGFGNAFFNTAGRNAIVTAAASYAGPGDFTMGQGNSMTIDGGSWTQTLGTNNWIKIGGGGAAAVVTVKNGGSFNVQCLTQQLRIGLDGGPGNFTVESTAAGLVVDPSNQTNIASGSSLTLQGGTNSFGQITDNGTLTISGGTNSLTNLTGTNILTVSGGSTTISGTVDTLATSVIAISAGSVTKSGAGNFNLNTSSTFLLSGSASFNMSGAGEFQPGAVAVPTSQGVSGSSSLSIGGIVAFQGGGAFNLSNQATITIAGSSNDGIFSNGGYINFTSLVSGSSITFTGTGAGQNNIFEGQVRYLGQSYTSLNYTTRFLVTHPTVGTTVITAVPEPSTYAVAVSLGCFALIYLRRRKLGLGS